tara:strand:+ start:84 stop:539 length:456 start_codon:yes stop_codon:yes gene_type:complete
MKKIFKNFTIIALAIFTILLSVGFNISKMKCAENKAIYLGSNAPSCYEITDLDCIATQKKISCCNLDFENICCPETADNSCSSITELVSFIFEINNNSFNKYDFSLLSYFLVDFYFKQHNYLSKNLITFQRDIPPEKLKKPLLSKIQSFLL